jgi:hypothetical protein
VIVQAPPAIVTPPAVVKSDRSAAAKKGWETRRRNAALKAGANVVAMRARA